MLVDHEAASPPSLLPESIPVHVDGAEDGDDDKVVVTLAMAVMINVIWWWC